MLGSIESDHYWGWAVSGKHPVAKDYLSLGQRTPLVKGFSDWVKNSYELLPIKKSSAVPVCSWRFWASGGRRHILVCGLLRGSTDTIGRPFPLLVMGAGPLKDWEDHWDLLPFACERTWAEMESLSAMTYRDLKDLEDQVRRIKPPEPDWPGFMEVQKGLVHRGSDPGKNDGSKEVQALEERVLTMAKEGEIIIPLNEERASDYLATIHEWLSALKRRLQGTAKAVFVGGNPLMAYLVLFRHPLGREDFARLWFLGREEE